MVVRLQISDLGFKMQDSSDFKIPSHRCSVSQVCRSPRRGGEYVNTQDLTKVRPSARALSAGFLKKKEHKNCTIGAWRLPCLSSVCRFCWVSLRSLKQVLSSVW